MFAAMTCQEHALNSADFTFDQRIRGRAVWSIYHLFLPLLQNVWIIQARTSNDANL